jgi:hypothetical protein
MFDQHHRQFGASIDTVGANKPEVVAELIYNTTRDVNVEFFSGCDYVLDQIELYEIQAPHPIKIAVITTATWAGFANAGPLLLQALLPDRPVPTDTQRRPR